MADEVKGYATLTSKEAKAAAIAAATTEVELDAMWAAWERGGWSRDGVLYAVVLRRKQEIGIKLSEGDLERIERTERARQAGAALPPITGGMGV